MPEIGTSTRLDNDSQRLHHRRLVNKIHSKKYYDKNREAILLKKRLIGKGLSHLNKYNQIK